jgi:hypothetical protein
MKYLCRIALFCLGILSLQAQAQATAPAPGPTMDQTIAFINDSFSKRGSFTTDGTDKISYLVVKYNLQSVRQENTCTLAISRTWEQNRPGNTDNIGLDPTDGLHRDRWELFLDRTDPLSVTVRASDSSTPPTYFVAINGSAFNRPIPEVPANATPETLPATYKVHGFVHSVSGNSLTLISEDGKLLILKNPPNDNYAEGDYIEVTRKPLGSVFGLVYNLERSSTGQRSLDTAVFTDKSLADRVAKAFVHAIVLCHKDDKPPPF